MKLRLTYHAHSKKRIKGHAPGTVIWAADDKRGNLRIRNDVLDVVMDERTTARVRGGSTRQRKEAIKTLQAWIVADPKDRLERGSVFGRWGRYLRWQASLTASH